jgi:predicted phage terminase large subunit-like protein
MQRLHEHDLCGYLQEIEKEDWEVLSLPAIRYEDGEPKALWEFKHTLPELYKIKEANANVFETQYMQNPTPLEGLMYGSFKTYDTLPITKTKIRKNYTDTADTGADFLCSINYVETEVGNYITDVLYTDKPMEYTEPMVAAMLHKDGINVSNIESNNGGRGFARQVEAQTRLLGNNNTKIEWFHQSANKQSRIFSRSNEVTNLTYFPTDWERKWPAFARHIKGFRKDGKDMHDDAEDCLTGTIEMRGKHNDDMKYYNGEQQGNRVVFIMPDNNDKFILLDVVVNDYINVENVVYQSGFDEDEMKRHLNRADDIVFECDKAFFSMARELREEYDVRILHKNTNQMLRISAQKSFVTDKVRYRNDYDEFPQYTAFMDAVMDEANCFEAMDAVSAMSVYVQKKCFS